MGTVGVAVTWWPFCKSSRFHVSYLQHDGQVEKSSCQHAKCDTEELSRCGVHHAVAELQAVGEG